MKASGLAKVGLLFVAALCIYVFAIGIKNVFRYNLFSLEYKKLQKEMIDQRKVNRTLKQTLILVNDPTYLEKEIKQKLGYVKSDEHVYYFTKKVYK